MKRGHWVIMVAVLVVAAGIVATRDRRAGEAAPQSATEPPPAPRTTSQPAAAKQGGTLVMGFYQEPELLNPLTATHIVASEVLRLFQRSLIGISPEGEFIPDLAKEVPTVQNGLVSEDGLTIRYNLREDVVWSDGDPFDCQDVVFTWETSVDFFSGAVGTGGNKDIESVTCEDPYTVVMRYATFYAPNLTRTWAMLPSHLGLDPAQMQEWDINRNPLSLGPFVMQEWISGDHMTVVRNENYAKWETEGKPYLDAIILRWIENLEVGMQLVRIGEIDYLWDLGEAYIPEARALEGIVVHATPTSRTERLVFNTVDPELDAPCAGFLRENPAPHWALGDVRVRQAIQLGIDKHRIVDRLLLGLAAVGTGEITRGWAKQNIPESEYNPDKARALLEQAGWTDADGDGIRECHGCPNADEGQVLKLKFQTTAGNVLRERVQLVIVEMMREVGVQLYIENVPGSVLFTGYASGAFRKHGQYDILMYATGPPLIDPHVHYRGYFESYSAPCDANAGAGFNYSRWSNDAFDRWIEVAVSSSDLRVRAEAYQKAGEQIAAEVPHVYLYERTAVDLLVQAFKGYNPGVWGGGDPDRRRMVAR